LLHELYSRMRACETLVGTWLYLNDVGVAEIVAGAELDFLMLDMEHSPTGFSDLRGMVMAIEHRCAPIVRVKANTPEFISAILDIGTAGVMVPRIRTASDAAFAVENAKYYPLGLRGMGPFRVSDYTRNMKEVLEQANEKQMLIVQIEHRDAITNIEEIVRVPGIDAFFIGPGDLSQSLGHLGDAGHPEVVSAIKTAVKAIRASGHPAGIALSNTGQLASWIAEGITFFTVGADFRFVLEGATNLAQSVRQIIGSGEPG